MKQAWAAPDWDFIVIGCGSQLSPIIMVPGMVAQAIISPTLNWHDTGDQNPALTNRGLGRRP